MTDQPNYEDRVRLLRDYLLDTLSDSERARVDAELATSPDWQNALNVERKALGALDCLPKLEAPSYLAARTIAAIEEAAHIENTRKSLWRRVLHPSAAIAMTAVVILCFAFLPPIFSPAREAARRSSSQNNLKQLGLVFKMYAGDNSGYYPPLAPLPGVWMFDISRVYPEYLSDLSVLVDPSRPDASQISEQLQKYAVATPIDWEGITRLAARSYTYPGWMVLSDSDVLAASERVQRLAKADYDSDLEVADKTLRRFREGVERFLITDINNPASSTPAQATVPLLFEATPSSHPSSDNAAHVLYMDGHVELVSQGTKFPVTKVVQETFGAPH